MLTKTNTDQVAVATTPCPNCWRLQQAADQRWIELQDLRARVLGLETMLSEYVWLVSESAADELDPHAWNDRVAQARSRAVDLLEAAGTSRPGS